MESSDDSKEKIDHLTGILHGASPSPTRYTRTGFFIGLPVILFFCVVCWAGTWYAFNQITTELTVYKQGVIVAGTVVKKTYYRQSRAWEQKHYITYSFTTPHGQTLKKEIRVKPRFWNSLKEKGPITIRYVPGKPSLNLPDSWHMISFFSLAGGISLIGAVFFTVALIGMLRKKLLGGYR